MPPMTTLASVSFGGTLAPTVSDAIHSSCTIAASQMDSGKQPSSRPTSGMTTSGWLSMS